MTAEKPKKGAKVNEASPSFSPPPLMFRALTHAQIAQRAYELYMQRKPVGTGTPEADWVQAELELRATLIDSN